MRGGNMRRASRFTFWLEVCLATFAGILSIITSIWRNWIEIVFGVELDAGNGSLEWLLVAILWLATFVLFFLARYEWRKTRATASAGLPTSGRT
jgi:hypothetical protein